jgi:hypothetical protein
MDSFCPITENGTHAIEWIYVCSLFYFGMEKASELILDSKKKKKKHFRIYLAIVFTDIKNL